MRIHQPVLVILALGLTCGLHACGSDSGSQPTFSEFQVNTTPPGQDGIGEGHMAIGPDGRFAVVWDDLSQLAVRGQLYDKDSSKVGTEFQVSLQSRAIHIAMGAQGQFALSWIQLLSETESELRGRRYAADGSVQGPDFFSIHTDVRTDMVETYATAIGSNGAIFAAWRSVDLDHQTLTCRGQLFAADGTKSGSELMLEPDDCEIVKLAASTSGTFLMAVKSGATLLVQRIAADGSKMGSAVQVNSELNDNLGFDIAADASGQAVVIWNTSNSPLAPSTILQAQRLAADGTKVGAAIQVDPGPAGSEFTPSVSIGPDGKFLVAWETEQPESGGATAPLAIRAQQFNADGTKAGDSFQVTGDPSILPIVASGPEGRSVITWLKGVVVGGQWTEISLQGRIFQN